MAFLDDYKQLTSGAFGDPNDSGSGAYNALQKLYAGNPDYKTQLAGTAGKAQYEDIWKYNGVTPDNVRIGADLEGGGGTSNSPAGLTGSNPVMQALIDNGSIGQTQRSYSNESGSGAVAENNVNWGSGSLPTMAPGVNLPDGQHWIAANQSSLINPNLVYNDPNYGRLTLAANDKSNLTNGYDLIGPIFAALLTMGAGALAAPAAGAAVAGAGASTGALGAGEQALMQLPTAARSLGSGAGYGGLLGLIGGLAGGATGIPLGSTLGKIGGSALGSAISPKAATAAPSTMSPQQKMQVLMALSTLPKKG